MKLCYGADGDATMVGADANGLDVDVVRLPTAGDSIADNAAFVDGTSKVIPPGYIFDEAAGTALTENDVAAARIDSKRAQVGVVEDATTRGQRAAVSAAGRLSVDASGVAVPITDNAGSLTVDAPVGTPAFVRLSDGSAAQVGQKAMTASLPVAIASDQSAVLVDTELPAAAALAEGATNPTSPMVGADNSLFNGTTWDRQHNNWRTTTGDTGAKTTTFNGATQTNYDNAGAFIVVQVGTVSGTTPTMSVALHVSYDAGTTWLQMSPGSTNLTASSTTAVLMVGPTNWSQTPGSAPTVMTMGTVFNAVNAFLPRTWRLVYTIGGTTPSFTITAVHVNYIGSA